MARWSEELEKLLKWMIAFIYVVSFMRWWSHIVCCIFMIFSHCIFWNINLWSLWSGGPTLYFVFLWYFELLNISLMFDISQLMNVITVLLKLVLTVISQQKPRSIWEVKNLFCIKCFNMILLQMTSWFVRVPWPHYKIFPFEGYVCKPVT